MSAIAVQSSDMHLCVNVYARGSNACVGTRRRLRSEYATTVCIASYETVCPANKKNKKRKLHVADERGISTSHMSRGHSGGAARAHASTGALCSKINQHGRCVPGPGWCDARVTTKPAPWHVEDEELLSLIRQGDSAFDEPEKVPVLKRCHALREELVATLIKEYGGTREDAARASAGGGVLKASQGNSPVSQFAFLVRWTLHAMRQRERRASGLTAHAPLMACETGFNWGLSALAFLCASPTTQVHSFDLPSGWPTSGTAGKPYIHIALAWLKRRFPGRIDLTLGDSLHTVSNFANRSRSTGDARPCDITFVDGGHTFGHAYADLRSFRCAARPGSLVLADDCRYAGGGKPGVRVAWLKLVNESRLAHVAQIGFSGAHAGCLGQYAIDEALPQDGSGRDV